MYKMKDVYQMTGLTEKAIRLYMDQKLVEPRVEEGIYRNAYYFEEKDIERLKDIAALRNAGFGISDIKMMIEDPTTISSLVEEKESLLKNEIEHMKSLRQTINRLTIEEHSDVTKLADAIEPRSAYKKETAKMSRVFRRCVVATILLVALAIPVMLNGTMMLKVYAGGFGISFGMIGMVSGIRYLLYGRKVRKRAYKGKGTIVSIVTSDKIEDYILNEDEKHSHDFAKLLLFGIGGMAIWESIRFDCWYPVIRYEDQDGKHRIATVRFGAYKKTWKIGDTIDVAWDAGKENLVYECKKKGIRQKALSYFITAVILLAVGLNFWIQQFIRIGLL